MTTIVERLDLTEYEAELQWTGRPSPAEELVDDDAVARMLLADDELELLDQDRPPGVAFESYDDRDGLAAMRGVMIGLAWVAPIWILAAAILVLA